MNDFDSFMAGGMAVADRVTGEPITIDGQNYTGTVNRFQANREMQEAGYVPGYALTVVISLAQMPALPPVDQRPVFAVYNGYSLPMFAGKQMRVAKDSEIDSAGATLYLEEVR